MTTYTVRSVHMTDISAPKRLTKSTAAFDEVDDARRKCYDELTCFVHSPKLYPAWQICLVAKRHWFSRGSVMELWRGTTSSIGRGE